METEEHYEYIVKKIEDLIPYATNSRTHSEEQVTQIASSIKEFKFSTKMDSFCQNLVNMGLSRGGLISPAGFSSVGMVQLLLLKKARIVCNYFPVKGKALE